MRISLRLLSILFLSFFVLTTVGEARNTRAFRNSVLVTKQQTKTTRHQKRTLPQLVTKKKQTVSNLKKIKQTRNLTPKRKLQTKKLQKRPAVVLSKKIRHVSISKKRSAIQKTKPTRKLVAKKPQKRPILATKKNQSLKLKPIKQKPIVRKKSPQPKVVHKKPLRKSIPSNKQINYFSHLNWHTQRNARIGKLDSLFAKNYLGQGQTIAVIEVSGTWDEMRNVVSGKGGSLSPVTREKYKRNFLPPIGDPRVDPNAKIDRIHPLLSASSNYYKHGSRVSSVLLDLSPHAKVLPVSTYETASKQFYDIADAWISLSKNQDVNVINVSGGRYECEVKLDYTSDYKDVFFKYSFSPRHLDALKILAKAGKVVVFAAGNEGIEYQDAAKPHPKDPLFEKYRLYLLENLDEETKESIIFAGNLDPNTCKAHGSSTRPGILKSAQDVFLYAPGEVDLSYGYDDYLIGTSYAAPVICAVIANLCARSPKITPKQAVRALLETADKHPDVRTYGRGIINAARALDWLEREVLK